MKIRFDSPKKQNPLYDGGMKVPYAPAKRAQAAWKWYAVVFLTASPLLFFLFKIIVSYVFVSSPAIVTMVKIDLNAPASGVITKVHVRTGDPIGVGSPVADISDPGAADRVRALTTEREGLRRGNDTRPAYERLKREIRLAENVQERQSAYLGQVRYLFSKGAATSAEVALAESRYDQARLEVSRARADYESTGTAGGGIVKGSRMEALETDIESAEKQVNFPFNSPAAGTVCDLYVSENQNIARGAPIAKIMVPGQYSITAYIAPSHINRARKGKKVTIKLPDNRILAGYVASDPKTAGSLPPGLSDSFTDIRQALETTLVIPEPLPEVYRIDGLPLTVYFGFKGY
jgi:multidrug resistance efflux pump